MDSQRKKEKTKVNISECMCVCFCMLYPSQQLNICSLRSCMCHCPVTLTLSAVFCHFVFAPAAVCVYVCNWMCLCVRLRCHICLSVHLCTWLTLLGCLCTSLLPCLCDPFITVVGCALLNPIQKKCLSLTVYILHCIEGLTKQDYRNCLYLQGGRIWCIIVKLFIPFILIHV